MAQSNSSKVLAVLAIVLGGALAVAPEAHAQKKGGGPARPPVSHPHHTPHHRPHHTPHHRPHHGHHHARPVVVGAPVEAPWQNVRYLHLSNQTGEALTVYVRGGDGVTRNWSFAPDETAYLAIDNVRLAASEVFIWAEGGGKRWDSRRDEALVLVSAPYRSAAVGTFTYTLNP